MKTPSGNYLFTPGPLNCPADVHAAMQKDLGSREDAFIKMVASIREQILRVAGLGQNQNYTAVPMQGSGTFAIESALASLIGREEKLLVLENGAYGKRLIEIAKRYNLPCATYSVDPTEVHDPQELAKLLAEDTAIRWVAVVHCETTTGILNPLKELAQIVHTAGRKLFVDAMSSFGAIPTGCNEGEIDCLVASANKCMESVPGFAFAITKLSLIQSAEGRCQSLSLDLHDQWQGLEQNGQFRFTPPTHSLCAFETALNIYFDEGGQPARENRYRENHKRLIERMSELGFRPVVHLQHQSPIITAFPFSAHPNFSFESLYQKLAQRGLIIYPGKLSSIDCFRIGTIGRISATEIENLVDAIKAVLQEMNVPIPVNHA